MPQIYIIIEFDGGMNGYSLYKKYLKMVLKKHISNIGQLVLNKISLKM